MTTVTNEQALLKMRRARIELLLEHAFFGDLATRLEFVEDTTLNPPTMAVDGKHIFYHPDFVMKTPFKEIVGVQVHEILHCVFAHGTRRDARDPKRWNIAADYAINPIIVEAGFALPKSGLINPAFAGMFAEEIYPLLPEDTKDEQMDSVKPPPSPGQGDKGGGDGDGDGQGQQAPDPTHAREMEDDWKISVIQAANLARAAGQLPGSIERLVDKLVESRTDWRVRLRQFARETTRDDYSWARVNRRYASLGIYLPGMYSEALGTIAVVTDDSGSIDDRMLQVFASEIANIRETSKIARLVVISCDARVNHVDDLGPYDAFEMKCHGGGGTDFRPPFKWLEDQGITPACLIYLTDLEGPLPEAPPSYPVLWCCTTDHIAPWGETLKVTPAP